NPVERQAFANTFLVTEDRERQLRFTSVLQEYSRSQAMAKASVTTPQAETTWRERLAALFSTNRPVLALAGSFAVLVLVLGLVWFISKQRRDSTPFVAKAPTSVSTAPPADSI